MTATEFRKQWSHQPTPIPQNASGLWYSVECVDQMLADYADHLAGWIKITDDPKTLPQVGVPVLVSWDRGPFRGWVRESMYLGDTTPQWKGFAPTHWQPLPAPPAAEQT